MEGLGVHAFWGMSPGKDIRKLIPEDQIVDDMNILIVGGGDLRHVLKTMSAIRRNNNMKKINIYIFDAPIDIIARHLMLLAIVTDWSVPIRTRVNTFLEVFGNILIQERTEKYLSQLSQDLIRFVCNGEGRLKRLVDLSCLKFKDTDTLETLFKGWKSPSTFNIKAAWEERLRGMYQQRFDSRKGIIDWDYQNGVKPYASIVHPQQYRHWRETGIAFEFGDQTYTMCNKTMVSYAEGRERGLSKLKLGYWGDIVCSPYIAFGIECDQPGQSEVDLFKIVNEGTGTEQHRHTAVHISVYNLLAIIHEIETGYQYRMKKQGDIYSGLGNDEVKKSEDATEVTGNDQQSRFALDVAHSVVQMKDLVTIYPVTGENFPSVFGRGKFTGFFDMVLFSNSTGHLCNSPVTQSILKTDSNEGVGIIAVETPTHIIPITPDQKLKFDSAFTAARGQKQWEKCQNIWCLSK